MATFTVHDYHTGLQLKGTPSAELVAASLAAPGGTGAVHAVLEDGVWEYVRADESYDACHTVYVEED